MTQQKSYRVLLLIDQLGSGGAERQLTYLATELKKAGCLVRLCRFYEGDVFYADDLESAGIKVETLTAAKSGLRRPFVLADLIRQWKPDAVIAYLEGPAMGACLARVLTKFNLIVSERNTTKTLDRRQKLKFFLYRFASHIVPNSYSQAQFIKDNFKSLTRKVTVITNTIDINRFRPTEEGLATPVVITTARIARQKNIINYLHALDILRKKGVEAKFEWFGMPESEEYLNEVLSTQKRLGLECMITFHPQGSKNIVAEYRKATHFCLPSNFEGFPNVLCEAMACCLVCTASDVCDNPSILTDSRRRFNPTSPQAIADAITASLAVSPKEAHEEGQRNRETIIRLCSPEVFTRKYLELISNQG